MGPGERPKCDCVKIIIETYYTLYLE